MPTISQLPAASEVSAADQLPISQGGSACAVSVGSLLASVQPAILAPTGTLLGRTSLGPGGPDPVSVGTGLALNTGTLAATGGDHAGFPIEGTLTLTDEAVLSSNGTPKLMPLSVLRGLYSPGTNIAIDQNGTISATGGDTSSNYSISDLPTVAVISAGDLVAISQNNTDHTITYANLLGGQTIDEIQGAATASDSDCLLTSQGGSIVLRQTLAAIWTWLNTKLPSYLLPVVELASNTALVTSVHNGRILVCSQPITITAASSTLENGFTCSIINASSGSVMLGSNIATSSGTSVVPPSQTAALTCVTYSGGTLVYAAVGFPAASASPPAQVNGLAENGTTSSSVLLSWEALAVAPRSYVVQYRVTGSGSWSGAPSITTTACAVTGLLAATSYDFVVSAVNGAGVGAPSTIVTAITLGNLAVPSQVTSLVANNATTSTVSLSWATPTAGGTVASYTVQYRTTGTTPWSTLAVSVTTTTCTVTALVAATSYDFQIFAVNATGSGPVSAITTASTATSGNSVTAVTWNAVPSGSYAHGSGTIAVNAHITPSTASVQFAFSMSATTPPTSWTTANYVNTNLWGAYVNTPSSTGTYYAWVEGTDGSLPTVYPTGFTVT